MKFDRNTVLGFVIMGILLVGYILYNKKEVDAKERRIQKLQNLIEKNYQGFNSPGFNCENPHPSGTQ